jgi:hypothetical protein
MNSTATVTGLSILNWKFYRGDVAGAELPDFDDYSWRVLDLPHDWSIEDLPATADTFPSLKSPRVWDLLHLPVKVVCPPVSFWEESDGTGRLFDGA